MPLPPFHPCRNHISPRQDQSLRRYAPGRTRNDCGACVWCISVSIRPAFSERARETGRWSRRLAYPKAASALAVTPQPRTRERRCARRAGRRLRNVPIQTLRPWFRNQRNKGQSTVAGQRRRSPRDRVGMRRSPPCCPDRLSAPRPPGPADAVNRRPVRTAEVRDP